jgi:hypothetical protein
VQLLILRPVRVATITSHVDFPVVDYFVDIVGVPDHADLSFAWKVIRSARIDSPVISGDYAACLDYSVAKKGFLTAYRWSGEHVLSPANIVYVNAENSG